MMSDKSYSVVVHPLPEADGEGYIAFVPELKGCMAVGDTREEAVSELGSAILEWIDEAIALGRPVPAPGQALIDAKRMKAEAEKARAASEEIIKRQEELIETLQGALEAARRLIEDLEDKDELRFQWAIDCDVPLPAFPGRLASAH